MGRCQTSSGHPGEMPVCLHLSCHHRHHWNTWKDIFEDAHNEKVQADLAEVRGLGVSLVMVARAGLRHGLNRLIIVCKIGPHVIQERRFCYLKYSFKLFTVKYWKIGHLQDQPICDTSLALTLNAIFLFIFQNILYFQFQVLRPHKAWTLQCLQYKLESFKCHKSGLSLLQLELLAIAVGEQHVPFTGGQRLREQYIRIISGEFRINVSYCQKSVFF